MAVTKQNKFLTLLLVEFLIGFLLKSAPFGLSTEGWRASVIFACFIISSLLGLAPIGVQSLIVLTLIGLFKLTPDSKALFTVFGSESIWLVIFAFFIAIGFRNTGLGNRISYGLIRLMGNSVQSVGYGLILCDLVVAPFIPSSNARGAGVGYPITTSVIDSLEIEDKEERRRAGSYFSMVSYHGNLLTSTLFLTAMATNPMALSMAKDLVDVDLSWGKWLMIMAIPSVLALLLIPYVLKRLIKPVDFDTAKIKQDASIKLVEMGKLKQSEMILIATFALMIFLWSFGKQFGVNATVVCMIATSILLVTNVIAYDDILKEKNAWDILIWMSPLLLLTSIMTKEGVIDRVVQLAQNLPMSVSWMSVYIIVSLLYVYLHYFFTSTVVHLQVLFLPFLTIMLSFGVPSLLAVMTLTTLLAITPGMTHYGTGTSGLYFSLGYTPQKQLWLIGFILSVIELVLFLGLLPLTTGWFG